MAPKEPTIAEQIEAALTDRDRRARRQKDPETMADLIDRIGDNVVEKLLAMGEPPEGEEEEEEEGERTPLADHPFFAPFAKARRGA